MATHRADYQRFEQVHPATAQWEGGWSDHPADPGGKTMYGVTEAVFHDWLAAQGLPHRPVRSIRKAEALQIYFANYWVPTAGRYNLFPGVDRATYDAAVNSGPSRAIKWLKASVGSNDHAETVKHICRKRLSFVQALTTWKVFGKGWSNRIADIEAKSVRDAVTAMAPGRQPGSQAAQARLEAERAAAAEEERKKGNQAATAGTGSAASGGAATQTDQVAEQAPVLPVDGIPADQLASWILVAVMAVAAIAMVAFLIRRRQAKARKEAYAREAAEVAA